MEMNIINQLTLRQMKFNKRRTVVTILGAIVSVAMITAVSTLYDLIFRGDARPNCQW